MSGETERDNKTERLDEGEKDLVGFTGWRVKTGPRKSFQELRSMTAWGGKTHDESSMLLALGFLDRIHVLSSSEGLRGVLGCGWSNDWIERVCVMARGRREHSHGGHAADVVVWWSSECSLSIHVVGVQWVVVFEMMMVEDVSLGHCVGLSMIEDRLSKTHARSIEVVHLSVWIARSKGVSWCEWSVVAAATRVSSGGVFLGFNAKLDALESSLCVRCMFSIFNGVEFHESEVVDPVIAKHLADHVDLHDHAKVVE